MEQFEPIELREFVQETLRQVELGAEQRPIPGTIDFEVLVTHTKKTGGALKIYVASGETGVSTERIQRVSFKIYPKNIDQRKKSQELAAPAY